MKNADSSESAFFAFSPKPIHLIQFISIQMHIDAVCDIYISLTGQSGELHIDSFVTAIHRKRRRVLRRSFIEIHRIGIQINPGVLYFDQTIVFETTENRRPAVQYHDPQCLLCMKKWECRRESLKTLFAPGCALSKYKPELISKINHFLLENAVIDDVYPQCCKSETEIKETVALITGCPGCSYKFASRFPDAQVMSLWKVLSDTDFPFPDYQGMRMSIHDSCHARHRNSSEMQDSVRLLCRKMNIELMEPEYTRDSAKCCGGSARDYETRKEMASRRAAEFPEDNVVVYCTGCTRSFSMTGVHPRHLLDLLFEETTEGLYPPKT